MKNLFGKSILTHKPFTMPVGKFYTVSFTTKEGEFKFLESAISSYVDMLYRMLKAGHLVALTVTPRDNNPFPF